MGLELRPVFQPALPGLVYEAEGKAVLDDLDALEEIASGHGIAPLTAFMDVREAPENFEDDDDFEDEPEAYLERVWGERTDWFQARDGLRAVRGLLDALQEDSTRDS